MSKLHSLALDAMEDLLSRKTPPFIRVSALKLLWESAIEEHTALIRPQAPLELVGDTALEYHDERHKWQMLDVQLYDSKGNSRIEDMD